MRTIEHFRLLGQSLSQSTLAGWIKHEDSIRRTVVQNGNVAKHARKARDTAFESRLNELVSLTLNKGVVLSGDTIKLLATNAYNDLEVPIDKRFKLSNGWLENYKKRNNLRNISFHGEAGSSNPETIANERTRLIALLTGWKPCDIYNMDETALFYA
ncbi:hypothetical protein COEREDRAFT_50630, partial [Coemansia reversa NRRL 1564]